MSNIRVPLDRIQEFSPTALGSLHGNFRSLLHQLEGQSLLAIRETLSKEIENLNRGSIKAKQHAAYLVTLNALRDYVDLGNYPIVRDGRCYLAPLTEAEGIDQEERRRLLRRQLVTSRKRAIEERDLVGSLLESRERLRELDYTPHQAIDSFLNAPPRLAVRRAGYDDVLGRELWKMVRWTWSMPPEASAPGREVSFVVSPEGYPSIPLGIIQLRNVVPEIRSRDKWLGITSTEGGFLRLFHGFPQEEKQRRISCVIQTLKSLLWHVRWQGLEGVESSEQRESASTQGLNDLATSARENYRVSRKNSTHNADFYLAVCKRAETVSDLLRGLRALTSPELTDVDSLLDSLTMDENRRADLDAGLRKIWHYHMGFVALDLSICGAAPPFGPARLGKLMAALAGSRDILRSWGYGRELGQIARTVYNERVREAVPNPGPLVVFTSGLYPGHSAQYNRVTSGGQRWLRIGDTLGYGNSNFSVSTSKAARHYNSLVDGYDYVARRFGEGASARFREVGRAFSRVGLPDMTKHQVQRPLYALPLVDDVPGALFGWRQEFTRAEGESKDVITNEWWNRWFASRAKELVSRVKQEKDLAATLDDILSPYVGVAAPNNAAIAQ